LSIVDILKIHFGVWGILQHRKVEKMQTAIVSGESIKDVLFKKSTKFLA